MGGRRVKSEILVYDGKRYTWSSKGYWRSTSMNNRHNLTRKIWESYNGQIPPGHKITYKDGNRYNVSIENLECLSHSEFQTQRLKDPDYRMMVKCYVIYGKLVRRIKGYADPESIKDCYRKIWETRRRRYGRSGRKDPI